MSIRQLTKEWVKDIQQQIDTMRPNLDISRFNPTNRLALSKSPYFECHNSTDWISIAAVVKGHAKLFGYISLHVVTNSCGLIWLSIGLDSGFVVSLDMRKLRIELQANPFPDDLVKLLENKSVIKVADDIHINVAKPMSSYGVCVEPLL